MFFGSINRNKEDFGAYSLSPQHFQISRKEVAKHSTFSKAIFYKDELNSIYSQLPEQVLKNLLWI